MEEEALRTGQTWDWVDLRGVTLKRLMDGAVRASFRRHDGNRTRMREELGVSKTNLLRKLDLLGLRKPRVYLERKGCIVRR